MKQPIAGVAPPEIEETTVMTVWPTLGATSFGRFLGQLYGIKLGVGFLTVGNLIALLSIPVVLPYYFITLAPPIPFTWHYHRRYRLTNRRVMILADRIRWGFVLGFIPFPRFQTGFAEQWVELDRFDAIDVVVRPGQAWYFAGDLIFRKGPIETFRLAGVSRPETFKHTCLKAHMGYAGVRKALAHV